MWARGPRERRGRKKRQGQPDARLPSPEALRADLARRFADHPDLEAILDLFELRVEMIAEQYDITPPEATIGRLRIVAD